MYKKKILLELGQCLKKKLISVTSCDCPFKLFMISLMKTTCFLFAEIIWVILQVDESGLLGLTQQLSQFGTELVSQNHCSASAPASPATNPFATPTKDFGDCPSMGDCGSPAQPAGWVSPSLSVIAHSGSLPGSPAAGTAPILPPVDISGTSPSHIRSLFQVSDYVNTLSVPHMLILRQSIPVSESWISNPSVDSQ